MTVTTATLKAAEVRDAMVSGGEMVINGVRGRWSAAGDEWGADDPSGADTVVLVRISDADDDEVDGVARQVADTAALAVRVGARVRAVLVENDTSAFKRKKIRLPSGGYQFRTVRPKFRQALDILSSGDVSRFISYQLDRTVRDPRDLEDLIDVVEQSRPRIVCESVTGSLRLANDSDIMAARILCAAANQSSRDTARRVSRARRQQAEEGRFGGGVRRYGFEEDGVTVRWGEEAEVIRRAGKAIRDGVAMKEIARDLVRDGVLTMDGRPWTAPGLRDILLRPRNAGLMVHRAGVRGRKAYTPDDVVGRLPGESIIPEDEYWSIVGILTDPDRRTNHVGSAPRWLGSGIYRCPCGSGLRVQVRKDKRKDRRTGEVTPIERIEYRCLKTDSGHVKIPEPELDALVTRTLLELIANSDPTDILGPARDGVDVPALRVELAEHRAKLDEIAADYDDELITRSQMLTRTKKRRTKIVQVEKQLATVAERNNPAVKLVGADDIHAAWDGLTLGEQREIMRHLLTVEVQPVGRGRRPAVRDRVDVRATITGGPL